MNAIARISASIDQQDQSLNRLRLSNAICERARLSKDSRFDGLFFTAVRSTKIYCRPICPAPVPKTSNVSYFPSAAAAAAAGYRPCLRCRPELSPQLQATPCLPLLARALAMIQDGFLQTCSMQALADQLQISSRHLQRIFISQLGATAHAVHATQRILLAKQLLTETRLSITDIGLAAGFNSLRRFNAAFLQHCGMPPNQIRRTLIEPTLAQSKATNSDLQLRVAYRPPLDFTAALQFLAKRAIPGIEHVDENGYQRFFLSDKRLASVTVRACPTRPELLLTLRDCPPQAIAEIVRRVRRVFDLDTDLHAVHSVFNHDAVLAKAIKQRPGLRIVGGWDGFEIAVRAVLGQQISVAGASTLCRRLVERFGEKTQLKDNQCFIAFPSPASLQHALLEQIGLPRTRANTLRQLAAAVANGSVSFAAGQTLDGFIHDCTALPGIGHWTANYIAMRGLAMPDAFPAGDLILRQRLSDNDTAIRQRDCEQRSQPWRPWRAYAVFQLWHM